MSAAAAPDPHDLIRAELDAERAEHRRGLEAKAPYRRHGPWGVPQHPLDVVANQLVTVAPAPPGWSVVASKDFEYEGRLAEHHTRSRVIALGQWSNGYVTPMVANIGGALVPLIGTDDEHWIVDVVHVDDDDPCDCEHYKRQYEGDNHTCQSCGRLPVWRHNPGMKAAVDAANGIIEAIDSMRSAVTRAIQRLPEGKEGPYGEWIRFDADSGPFTKHLSTIPAPAPAPVMCSCDRSHDPVVGLAVGWIVRIDGDEDYLDALVHLEGQGPHVCRDWTAAVRP